MMMGYAIIDDRCVEMEGYLQGNLTRLVLATGIVLGFGALLGYITRTTGIDRRFAAPICVVIIVPAWIVLGIFHLALWRPIGILLLLYPGILLCVGTSIGALVAQAARRRRERM